MPSIKTLSLAYAATAGERLLLDPAGAAGNGEEVCPCMMGFGFMGGGPFGFLFMLLFLIIMIVVIVGAVALVVAIARWAFTSIGGSGSRQHTSDVKEELEFLRREVEALRRRLEEK